MTMMAGRQNENLWMWFDSSESDQHQLILAGMRVREIVTHSVIVIASGS
jgi:hypothetical protein